MVTLAELEIKIGKTINEFKQTKQDFWLAKSKSPSSPDYDGDKVAELFKKHEKQVGELNELLDQHENLKQTAKDETTEGAKYKTLQMFLENVLGVDNSDVAITLMGGKKLEVLAREWKERGEKIKELETKKIEENAEAKEAREELNRICKKLDDGEFNIIEDAEWNKLCRTKLKNCFTKLGIEETWVFLWRCFLERLEE
jgi:hypothetical protein